MKLCMHRKGHLWANAKPLTEDQQKLVTENLPLAYHYSKKRPIIGIDPDENESEALFCLTRAASNFDPALGFKFTTFAWTVWLNHRKDAHRESQAVTKGYATAQTAYHDDNAKMFDPEDKQPGPDEICERKEEIEDKRNVLRILDPRSRLVMRMKAEGQSLKEIGDALGTTRERIRQIVNRSIFRIQSQFQLGHDLENKAIRELYEAQMAQEKAHERYQEKIKAIRKARKKNPFASAKMIATNLGISERMVLKHGQYKGRKKRAVA